MSEEIKNALEQAKAIGAGITLGILGGWIPTKYDVLPDDGQEVIVTHHTSTGLLEVEMAHYTKEQGFYLYNCRSEVKTERITAWLPAPRAYTEDKV